MRSHDKIGFRLSRILTRLNSGARLGIDELVEEFNVNKRTILRDFERLSILLIQKENGKYGTTLRAQLWLQKDRFGDVIIDAGGRDSSALRVALALSDVVVAPFAPRSFDVWALNDLAALAEEALAINEHLRCLAVLNCADPGRSPDNTEAEAAVRDAPPFTYLPTPLCRRKVFGNAAASGLCVTEHRPKDTKAVMEFQALYKALFGSGTANI